jgi:outer membrane protein OmpA-like peptidoglycan-associated protein
MKLFFIKAACIAAIVSGPLAASSQSYYVVVGAFAAKDDASEFKGFLPSQFADTSYSVSEKDKMLHFYVLKTSDQESAMARATDLRKVVDEWRSEKSFSAPTSAEQRIEGKIADTRHERSELALTESSSASASAPASLGSSANLPPRPAGKYFKFQIEAPDGQSLMAQVHHVDLAEGRELAAYETNTFVDLLRPGDRSKPMAVVCGLFGYKEIQKYIDYADPSSFDENAYVDADGAWVIPYKLERVEAGDVSVMYNVSFYKDAALMRRSSQVDLDELVKMMHSNPYYEITIHSHCDGKNKREIIAPGPDKNYFDASGAVKVNGSAKDLTTLRAQAIKSYLMDNGIDPARIDIFSWGASDMLVRGEDVDTSINDRIEIEFTRD